MKKDKTDPLDDICPWCMEQFTTEGEYRPLSFKEAVENSELDDPRLWTMAEERQRQEGLKACRKCLREYLEQKRIEIKEMDREDRLVGRIRVEMVKIGLGFLAASAIGGMILHSC